jgi:hypothetical protein
MRDRIGNNVYHRVVTRPGIYVCGILSVVGWRSIPEVPRGRLAGDDVIGVRPAGFASVGVKINAIPVDDKVEQGIARTGVRRVAGRRWNIGSTGIYDGRIHLCFQGCHYQKAT